MGYVEIEGRIFGDSDKPQAKFRAVVSEVADLSRRTRPSATVETSPMGLTLGAEEYTIIVGMDDPRLVVTILWPGMSARLGTLEDDVPARAAAEAIVNLLDPREVRRRLLVQGDRTAFRAFNERLRKVAA